MCFKEKTKVFDLARPPRIRESLAHLGLRGSPMSLSVRFYLFADDGLQRISHRLMEGLAHGKDAIPQYAGTKQMVANVVLELDSAKPVKIARADGSYLTFDENGQVHTNLVASGFAATQTYRALERSERTAVTGKVLDLSPKLNREKWERENRWTLSKEDLDAIADDIWKRKKATTPKVQQAKGIAPKPPTITWEAKQAMKEIQTHVWGITGKLEHLGEPALKSVSFEARKNARSDFENAIWLGVGSVADRRLEILARHRTGRGVWYASVDLIQWDPVSRIGETVRTSHERCNSKKEAEEAARRLLAENAKHFSAALSVETSVVCDLEWDGED